MVGNGPRRANGLGPWIPKQLETFRCPRDNPLTKPSSCEGLLANEVDSWMTGINRNVEGKETRRIMRFSGGHPAFRDRCEAVAADGYRELALA